LPESQVYYYPLTNQQQSQQPQQLLYYPYGSNNELGSPYNYQPTSTNYYPYGMGGAGSSTPYHLYYIWSQLPNNVGSQQPQQQPFHPALLPQPTATLRPPKFAPPKFTAPPTTPDLFRTERGHTSRPMWNKWKGCYRREEDGKLVCTFEGKSKRLFEALWRIIIDDGDGTEEMEDNEV